MKNKDKDEDFEPVPLDLWKFRFQEPLSREENNELILQYRQTQDKEKRQKIRDKIVYGNMPLAIQFLNRKYFSTDNVKRDDLLQEAAFAIMRGVDLFNPDEDVAFSTYLSKAFANILKRQFELDKRSNAVARFGELLPSKGHDGTCYMIEEVVEEPYFDHAWVVDKVELDNLLQKILPKFSPVEQAIFQDTFFKDMTQEEIAKKHHVTRQYISKIRREIVGEIRKFYEQGHSAGCKRNRNSLFYEKPQDAHLQQHETKSPAREKKDKTK